MKKNVCHYIPYHKDYHSIHTVHLVLEANADIYTRFSSQSIYKMHYVYSGSGILNTTDKQIELKKGDIFFTFPSMPFCVDSPNDFSCIYISFLGTRANMIMKKIGISQQNHYFPECNEVELFLEKGLRSKPELCDILSESILLYVFSYIGERLIMENENDKPKVDLVSMIKKYIDDHFSMPELSLEYLSNALRYNQKYISHSFKKEFGIGISKYINTIRMQHAVTLMKQGFSCISDIALNCGYSDPKYFSKLFKESFLQTPTKYYQEMHSLASESEESPELT
ncbi:MAG: helix-turn-helix domain-containing protein [Clostridia bacterium]|nr:helix-turn-helix domain-containing protein [Clostridia bacterium]